MGAALGASRASAQDAEATGRQAAPDTREQALIELGRRLFFDPKASRTASRACADCHLPSHGFSDPRQFSDDELGLTRRHSQTLVDSRLNPTAHWDGEFVSVEHLVLARIGALPGGSHGFTGSIVTASERRQRQRQARQDGPVTGSQAAPVARPSTPGAAGASPGADAGKGGSGGGASGGAASGGGATGSGEPAATPGTADAGAGSADSPKPQDQGSGTSVGGGSLPEQTQAPRRAGTGYFKAAGGSVPKTGRAPKEGDAPNSNQPQEPADAPGAQPAETPDEAGSSSVPTTPAGVTPEAKSPAVEPHDEPTAEALRREQQAALVELALLPPVSQVLEQEGRYGEAFQAAFGSSAVNDVRIAQAVAAYVRSIESTPSNYDRYVDGEGDALSPLAKQGLALFRGRAGCVQCHAIEGRNAPFTDYAFHNTGLSWKALTPADRLALGGVEERALREQALDSGRQGVSSRPSERRAFKTPTLRDVALRAPYGHDGSLSTLADVVRHYATGGSDDPRQDARVRGFAATEQEVAALVAFLESLSGAQRPGLARGVWGRRADETRLTFVDASGQPLAGLKVRLLGVGDEVPSSRPSHDDLALETDERGQLVYTPFAASTHTQIVLPADMGTLKHEWIPDSCRTATVQVPVLGRVRVVISALDTRALPHTLVVDLPGAKGVPGQAPPRGTLTRVGAVTGDAGLRTALYAGWVRADLPRVGHLRVPGADALARATPSIVLHLDAGATLHVDLR